MDSMTSLSEEFVVQKSKRASRACVRCKYQHVSCGSERPCKRCMDSGCAAGCRDSVPKKRTKTFQGSVPNNNDSFGTNGNLQYPSSLEDQLLYPNSSSPHQQLQYEQVPHYEFNDTDSTFERELSGSSDYSPPVSENNIDLLTNCYEIVSHHTPLSLHIKDETVVKIEDVRDFITKREWLPAKEAKMFSSSLLSLLCRRIEWEKTWTEEQRTRICQNRSSKLESIMISINNNPVASIIRNEFSKVLHANEAFKKLTGFPEFYSEKHGLFESLTLLEGKPELFKMMSWNTLSFIPESMNFRCFVRVWNNNQGFKTVKLHGMDYIEGTCQIEGNLVDIADYAQFNTLHFIPLPSE
eukprot:TRINITY_DN213_c0_g1_i1.p1 TRINITY_DN213_c0_g1~~TRINITY_DN213_c0_g1_i1.p1  ORF type:complete len:353 (+),score=64.80 TRINITY_DN213_c0_g1_i1:164-1222(+)